MIGATAPF